MDTKPKPDQPRMLSLEEFAVLIRNMREIYQWSQETLAELAGLNVRTVQRVETAKSASTDTRRALAVAFGLEDIDAFNKPVNMPTQEQLKEEKARMDRDYLTLPSHPPLHWAATRQTCRKLQGGYLTTRIRNVA